MAAMLSFGGVTLLLSTGYTYGAGLHASRLSQRACATLLCLAAVDLLATAALSTWRHKRFDRSRP